MLKPGISKDPGFFFFANNKACTLYTYLIPFIKVFIPFMTKT